MRAREAARVVVRDPDGRVLLMRYDDPPPMGVHWAAPGGGVEPGEALRAAAARELREETGWDDVEPGEELGTTSRTVHRREGAAEQVETHFLAAVAEDRRPVDESGHAVDEIAGWAWMTLEEVAALDVPVVPPDLVAWLRARA